MVKSNASEMYNGWIIGNFMPSIFKTDKFELAVKDFEKGNIIGGYYHRIGREVYFVVSGAALIAGEECKANDIVMIEPYEEVYFEAKSDNTKVVVCRIPCPKSDRYPMEMLKNDKKVEPSIKKDDVNKIFSLMSDIINSIDYANNFEKGSKIDYMHMQKEFYNDENITPENIVGQYDWHENYPYETFLLHRNGDIRKPLFENTKELKALDFACGPGRMVKRMRNFFGQVDGCDISDRLIEEARKRVPESNFYVTNGNNLGDVPTGYYDFIYCTISMQHIASYDIRREILKCMKDALKKGGKIVLQMAYNPEFPYVGEVSSVKIGDKNIKIMGKMPMSNYMDDDFNAGVTNGAHDVGIGKNDISTVKTDIEGIFDNVAIWFSDVSNYYENLEGKRHDNYWAKSWIYLYGEKQ